MTQIQERLDPILGTLEQGLNWVGYIPVVSTISAGFRAGFGKLEIIGGVAAAAITALVALSNPDQTARQRGLDKAVEILSTYVLHGVANIFRSVIEAVPFLSLATCLPYDLLGNRFSYPREGVLPFRLPVSIRA